MGVDTAVRLSLNGANGLELMRRLCYVDRFEDPLCLVLAPKFVVLHFAAAHEFPKLYEIAGCCLCNKSNPI